MRKVLIVPALAGVLFAAACGEDGEPTAVATTAKVRFFNAVWNAPDGIGFTANSQFAPGSALAYGQATPSCASLSAGSTTFGIGVANASGTALNSGALATLANQPVADGGNYTVLAGGNVVHPSVVMLDNGVPGLGANQAAVRFVNLAASSEFPFDVLRGTVGSGPTTVAHTGVAFRAATPFSTVSSGATVYSIMYNHAPVISGNAATLNLQAGSVNTVVIVRNLAGNFQLVNVPSCA